jgi:ligand-binding sensor domain-containing protein/class 3 adenylate cyclase
MSWRGIFWGIFLGILGITFGFGSEPIKVGIPQLNPDATLHLQSLNVYHGLNSAYINTLLMDRDGNLWIGYNRMGISKYDGNSITHYTANDGLTHLPIQCMLQDRHGDLWIGTEAAGVFRYDGHHFESFELNSKDIRDILELENGEIWLATEENGVIWYDGKKFHEGDILPGGHLRALAQGALGEIWIGTQGDGLWKWEDRELTQYTEKDGLADDNIKSLYVDHAGYLWIGGYGKGISRFDGIHSFDNYDRGDGLCGDRVVSIAESPDGTLWFGTYAGGACSFRGKGFTVLDESMGLTHNHIPAILPDSSGNIWLGTAGGGINLYRPQSFSHYPLNVGTGKTKVKALTEDPWGNLWIGTSRKGLLRFDGTHLKAYTTENGLSTHRIAALECDPAGLLSIGTLKGGLMRIQLTPEGLGQVNSFPLDSSDPSENSILSLYRDSRDDLWIGTAGGNVYRWREERFQPVGKSWKEGLTTFAIREDKNGTIWLATAEAGLLTWDQEKWEVPSFPPALNSLTAQSLYADPAGNLWIGTEGEGLIKWEGQNFRTFTTKEGLGSNFISSLQADAEGNLWVGTPKGMNYLYPLTDSLPTLLHFDRKDGLKEVDNFRNSVWLDRQNRIWWGSVNGLTQLDLTDYPLPQSSPAARLSFLKINQKFIDFHQFQEGAPLEDLPFYQELAKVVDSVPPFVNYPLNPSFPHSLNHLTFHFSAIDWQSPHRIRYAYKMEGLDPEWSSADQKNTADYRNVPSGKFTFKVKAKSGTGEWGPEFAYAFRILPPWWQTWWARLGYLLLVLGCFYLIYRWRVAALEKRQIHLEETVTERTAEIVSQKEIILKEKERSDSILKNILPDETASELKQHGYVNPKTYEVVSVLFTDFKGFTQVSEQLSPVDLVEEIHYCYKAFDMIMERFGIEKIKTIGDAYMAAGGIPTPNANNPVNTVKAALAIRDFMEVYQNRRKQEGRTPFEIRIGVHTGPVVAGLVGIKKFAYDIWGDTVNTAARMESSGAVGQVNISGQTYEKVKAHFRCVHRGKIPAKNKGELDMYFVDHLN